MKKQIPLTAIVLGAIWASGADEICLSDGGRTDCKIVVDAAAPLPVQFAAEELQTFLRESTGADFEIVSAATGPTIEVGTEKARSIVSAASHTDLLSRGYKSLVCRD